MMKAFFKSLAEDLKKEFFGHWLRVIGFLVCYVGPLAFIGACYVTRKPSAGAEFSIPFLAWPALVALILFYWASFRKWSYARLAVMESQNDMSPGKHYASIVLLRIVSCVFSAAPFFLVWWLLLKLEELAVSASFCFLVIGLIESFGGFFMVLDAVYSRSGK